MLSIRAELSAAYDQSTVVVASNATGKSVTTTGM
jgi:hypothetical protein